jgi:hypothetical protein
MIVLAIFLMQGCSKKKDLQLLSPRQIAELYIKPENQSDIKLRRQIIYFPPGTSEAEIRKRVESAVPSRDTKEDERMLRAAGLRMTTEYEKILTEDTAEVGVVAKIGVGLSFKRKPADQLIMKKDNGIWKVDYYRGSLTKEQLISAIRENPKAAWAYYNLGVETLADNPYKAYKYFNKYYELEPKGFWVDSLLLDSVEFHRNPQKMEQILLENIQKTPENSDGQAVDYVRLGRLFTEHEDLKKAQMYLDKAAAILKENSCRNTYIIQELEDAQEELKLRKEGKYHDILDEIEKSQNK